MARVIYACDVGSVRAGRFAWARVEPDAGVPRVSLSIDELVASLRRDVATRDLSIALGFESPLFMPVPNDSAALSRGRKGEGQRSMFAAAGATVMALGIQEAAWILWRMRRDEGRGMEYTLDWRNWPPLEGRRSLLLWEAFVSGEVHGPSHEHDAATAAVYFRDHERYLGDVNAVTTEQALNLVHAAALWAGWTDDVDRLHQPCLVLKPERRYEGPVERAKGGGGVSQSGGAAN